MRESSEQFRLAQEALGIVTWIWDLGDDRVQWHGDMGRLLGLEPGSFTGRFEDYLRHVHAEDAARARATFIECMKGLRPEYRTAERVVWNDGSVHWLETYGRANYDAAGRAMRMTGVIKDITERKRQESAREDSERKFVALFETSPVGIVVSRPAERRIAEINDAALRLLGMSRSQAIGALTAEVVSWPDRAHAEELRLRALAGERIVGAPLRLQRQDGAILEILASFSLLDLGGEPHFVIAVLDVTEQSRMERERHQADARYRALFDSTSDGITVLSPDWVLIGANPGACRLTGYELRELIGRPLESLLDPAELQAEPLRRGRQWQLTERTVIRKDGSRCAIEVTAGDLPDGSRIAIVRDVSERKRNETLLMNVAKGVSAELGEAFFRSLVEHLTRELGADMAFIGAVVPPLNDRVRTLACVADGTIVENFEYRLEGSPCLNAIAKRGTVIYPEGVADMFPRDSGLRKRGIEAYIGTSLHAADGSALGVLVVMHKKPVERGLFWASMIEIFGARAAAEIERARAEALVRQTNASLEQVVRQRTAQLEAANRDLESFNYSISHDLRQPLNAIAGFSELLRETGVSSKGAEEYLGEIESNAGRMERMIEALLRLAGAQRNPLLEAAVDVNAVVDAVLRDLAAIARLEGEVVVGKLPPARGDAALLRQVWDNLIGNAIKYSRRSAAPRIEISGVLREENVEYEVRDNGVGFDMRQADRLFGAFQRLSSAASFEGSGIGLAIAERIVRRHGGNISAESAPGKGATFRFTLPAAGEPTISAKTTA